MRMIQFDLSLSSHQIEISYETVLRCLQFVRMNTVTQSAIYSFVAKFQSQNCEVIEVNGSECDQGIAEICIKSCLLSLNSRIQCRSVASWNSVSAFLVAGISVESAGGTMKGSQLLCPCCGSIIVTSWYEVSI